MRRLGLSIPRSAHATNHPLDKAVTPAKLFELLGGQFQPSPFDQKGKMLG